ncbi:MAG: site-2 protease family protein [bacterium]
MKLDPFIIIQFTALIFSITIHEASHAFIADKCGDPTARNLGRVTINPLPHMDLLGTIIIPLTMMIFSPGIALIGWGKPCPVNPLNFNNRERDDMLISFAGPFSNFLAALASVLIVKILLLIGIHSTGTFALFRALISINLILIVFNLIPIPPLDGSHILRQLLPEKQKTIFDMLDRWGILILLIFVNTPLFALFYRILAKPILSLFNYIILL